MKIVIDNAIPFIKGVFEPYCDVLYRDGKSFTVGDIADADALVIRTRTHCNAALLAGSSVRHIATATIGFDHIDREYCSEQNIEVSTAAGCNARAVLQWVSSVLVTLSRSEGWTPNERVLGVVGVGNVGSLVERYARLWGFEVVCCDPPRHKAEGGEFASLEELISKSDIITIHTPLNDSTRQMFDTETLQKCKPNATIINSSRGEVVSNIALVESGLKFALDVWEGEPNINDEALSKAIIATPHIAGYSLQGKANASTMAVRSVARALDLPLKEWSAPVPRVEARDIEWSELCQTIDTKTNIYNESDYLKSHKNKFEAIRDNYDYRLEYF